jgi:hypothetical protein
MKESEARRNSQWLHYARLGGMHDATNFWLLAGTAAPVIALANVVGFGDTAQLMLELTSMRRKSATNAEPNLVGIRDTDQLRLALASLRRDADHKRQVRNGLIMANLAMGISTVNLITQTIVLFAALRFFGEGVSWYSEYTVEYILIYGMVAILSATFLANSLRHSTAKIKSTAQASMTSDTTPQQETSTDQDGS